MSLKLAIVSTGRIADGQLAPALKHQEDAVLWSVLSRNRQRATEFAKRHGARSPNPAYDDLDALLADPKLDGVIIASPDRLHAEHALAAVRAGKHVLCEKPMVTEMDEGRELVDAARAAGVRLGVAYHMRHHAGHRRLHGLVQAGKLGTLRHARVQWTWQAPDDGNWRAHSDVGRWWALAGVGTHLLDQLRWIMGPTCGEVVRLESVIAHSVFNGPHDETAVLALQFETGATAELCASVLFDAPKRLEVYGSRGYGICEDTFGPHGEGDIWTDRGKLPFTPTNPFAGEIADFAAAIREERDPEVNGEEGLRNVELLLRAVGAAA
ncbi:MAG: Gfo/Idh/MocA family oxidoreductase [Ectothiorhodospiraceae bacterium]|nr:Gfo/Idh/MocA family oxidoreductase [Ectothiorhodospiraceae bacterium]